MKMYIVFFEWAEGETRVFAKANNEAAAELKALRELSRKTGSKEQDDENRAILHCKHRKITVKDTSLL